VDNLTFNDKSNKSLNFSGRNTFLSLSFCILAIALGLDLVSQRFLQIGSLTIPLILGAIASMGLGLWAVPLLQKIKAGQVIREDGPQAHLKKAGTPTMGGAFFVPTGVIFGLVLANFHPNVIAVSVLTLAYAFIGWLDDWQILRKKSNNGISPKMKLALQVGFASLFCLWLWWTQPSSIITNVALPFGLSLSLGGLFWGLAIFTLVAESNATNLTDGVDGLMGGLGAIAFLGLAAYLAPTHPELMILAACMSGSCLGFLYHNHNPAQVFMGDTGSLALGGALGAIALLSNSLWVLLIISGIFLIETLSVIAQVLYYKSTKGPDGVGKRLFKMAPYHHHLELSGWAETQVVGMFYLVNLVLVLVCLLIGS